MKILFIAPYLPSTLRIRPYRLIQYLSKRHEITFVGLVQPAWTSQFLNDLKPFCKDIYPIELNRPSCIGNSLLAVPSRKPMSVAYFSSKKMESLILRLVEESKFDLIHTEHIRAAPYTVGIKGLPKLFDSVDSLALAYERGWRNRHGSLINRIVAYEEWLKMRNFEPKMARAFDQVIISSPVDQKLLSSDSGPTVEVISNGVDLDYFKLDDREKDENSIVFVGAMNYYVNVESVLHFYNYVFANVKKLNPQVRFSVVGADPKKPIRNLARDNSVEVTGYVTDIRPYISRASVFVCPMVGGSGIQNKLLQAMSMGTPVVTTSIAIQSLSVKDGEHLLVADEPQQFAEAVTTLLNNKNLQKILSENARKYVEEHHDWETTGLKLEALYRKIL
jgi:polysaccharide biosynthesis protein PslH